MQEQELLSTRPHLPTSAMTLWQRAGLIIYISIHFPPRLVQMTLHQI